MHWMQCKKPQLSAKFRFWNRWWFFSIFFPFFQKRYFAELRLLAWHSVHQTPSFELSKSTIFLIFHHKGWPLWFRTLQKLMTPLKMAENKKKLNYFCKQNYKQINNSDGTACLKGWIKIRISQTQQMTHDTWQVGRGELVQYFSSLALLVWQRGCFKDWEKGLHRV